MKKSKNNKGFTLIEVLIVISIIGLLSAATLIGLGTFRSTGKDARRASDLRQIQNALELYYTKESNYPAKADYVDVGTLGLTTAGIGVNSLPFDPDGGTQATTKYSYKVCGSGYVLKATLSDKMNNKGTATTCDANCGENGSNTIYCVAF